ncbi:MAG: hypothetical protein M1834_002789 [Cirrosporium novae-zelandiae]|nr:MAG: hypothetical protein M1834_002789 [Cirrosporium novae-zelandiae]
MPFFLKVFKGKDGKSKHGKQNGDFADAPAKPTWTDAWLRTEVEPEEVQELIRGCTNEVKARALDMPFLLLPFRPASDPSAARTFIRNFFKNGPGAATLHGEYLAQELRLTDPMVLCSVMKWCWSRLAGGVVTWEAYELFKIGEQDSNMARDAFATFIPISVESDARTKIVFDFFDLMAAVAAHGKTNGLGGRKLSRYAGWWAFSHCDTGLGFEGGYKNWVKAADATSHLFFAYLRSLSPETNTHGISGLPISLQTLSQGTEYPPERPSLMQNSTTKVIMIVDTVSPTPFSLLRRARHFQYRDDDRALQEFSNYDDPVKALTDECRRVLKCISSTNQSIVSSSKNSTTLRSASWSRFEDIGFGGLEESDNDDELDSSALSPRKPEGLRTTPHSKTQGLGRPTTPSWADFLSTGFADDASNKTSPSLLLPPDKILPPIRGQSSQSHRRMGDNESILEPGELASIMMIDLDDAFWWVWITSLAGEEAPARKGAFGRGALIETIIRGARWLVMEEQLKGAAPEPDPKAYIAEKKGLFTFGRKNRLKRAKTTGGKKNLHPGELTEQDGTSKISVGPDQHARIQAAARALQERQQNKENGRNGFRRGRLDDAASQKTSSVFTLQPMIMSEAAPAMKWAHSYDRTAVRAKYLGSNLAGKGMSTDQLSTIAGSEIMGPSSGRTTPAFNKSTSNLPRSPSHISQAELDRDLPAPPNGGNKQSERSVSPEPSPATEPAQVSVPPATPEPVKTIGRKPVGSPKQVRHKTEEVASPTSSVPPERSITPAPASPSPKSSPKRSPDQKRNKLEKKSHQPSGLKAFFGKKRAAKNTELSVADRAAAIEAAHAALSGRSSRASVSRDELAPPEVKAGRRFSGFMKKSQPSRVATPEPTPVVETNNEPIVSEPLVPMPTAEPRSHTPELARTESNEERRAVKEFSSFDQGPLEDVPAFAPGNNDDECISPTSPDPHAIPEEPEEERMSDDTRTSMSPPQSPHDRWAQIRKNAADRAARASEEQSRGGQTEKTITDDGETSGEETIESRVARIKARVAELTGNMENAR